MDGWEGVEVLGGGSDRRSISFFGRPGSRCPKDCFRPSRGWLLWPWLRCTVSAIAGMPIRDGVVKEGVLGAQFILPDRQQLAFVFRVLGGRVAMASVPGIGFSLPQLRGKAGRYSMSYGVFSPIEAVAIVALVGVYGIRDFG